MDVDLIYDSKVIERYYSRHFGKRGSLIYYPSDFANKVYNLKSKKKINSKSNFSDEICS